MVTCQAMLALSLLAAPGDAVLLNFTSDNCGHCRTMRQPIAQLVAAGYRVQEINVDRQPEVALRYRVTGVPAFVLLAGGREVDRVVGACSRDRLAQMFAKAEPAGARRDTLTARGQSLERAVPLEQPVAAASPRQASRAVIDAAMRASVRVRVEDPTGQSVGSGTIIDAQQGEALLVTCGHLFREAPPQSTIHIDLFDADRQRTLAGHLISYDLALDIAFVSFTPDQPVTTARVAPGGFQFRRGDAVFSIGCDHGEAPSVRESQITAIDRYKGPPNLEVAGEPPSGRSGGGLFTAGGSLIGVCNHGDPADNAGLYASLPTVHWSLDRIGQRRIYQATSQLASAAPTQPPRGDSAVPDVPKQMPQPSAPSRSRSTAIDDTEVICIVRSRSDPSAGERVYVLDRPSSTLLNQLTTQGQLTTEGRIARTPSPRRDLVPVTPRPQRPVVRAQSKGR